MNMFCKYAKNNIIKDNEKLTIPCKIGDKMVSFYIEKSY